MRQYMNAIFPLNASQEAAARASITALEARSGPIHTALIPITAMVKAEDYHQKYYLKHSLRLMQAIASCYPDEKDWDDSTLAARLNSFAGGYGEAALFDQEAEAMELPGELAADLRAGLARRAKRETIIGTCQRPTADF